MIPELPPDWGLHIRLLVCWEFLVYRVLARCIRAINCVVPFSKRHLVRVLLALYVLGEVGDLVTARQSPFWVVFPLIVVASILQRDTESERSVLTLTLGVWRLGVFLFACMSGVAFFHLGRRWEALAQVAFAVLQYAAAMPGGPPKGRRRVLEALTETAERPGYSTA